MTPEQAADARRRKKEELERQLAALDEEDRYYARASQPPDVYRHREPVAYNAPPPNYPSRNDVISPPWPQTAASTSSSTGWRTAVPTGSSASGHSQRLPVQASYQPVPDTAPISSSSANSQAPWSRTRLPSLASSNPTGSNNIYTPSPNSHSRQPRMPNPFSPTFINIPVPSKEQVEEYLIRAQGQPLGLRTGWIINNHSFDVYDLFLATTRLGGSKAITRRLCWPEMAGTMGISGVNTPHGPDMEKTGHQLHTFFTTHLGALEEMWERTSGTAEDAGGSYSTLNDSHSRSHLLRLPQAVSSAREGHDEEVGPSFTRTYPPQPPPPRGSPPSASASESRSTGRPAGQPSAPQSQSKSKQRRPAQTSSVPLHVNPVDVSTSRTTDTQAMPLSAGSSYTQPQSQAYAPDQRYTSSQPQHITNAQFASISPTLHHPAPSSLAQERVPSRLDQQASVPSQEPPTMRADAAPQSSAAPTNGTAQPAAQVGQPSTARPPASGSKSTAGLFPTLSSYTPPKFVSFDHLVQTNALKLPKLPPNVHLDYVGSHSEIFAKRCFELRSVVKKIQAKQPARHISAEEMMFWQKLLAILRHNPQVIIPGHQGDTPMTTDNAQLAPSQVETTALNGQSAIAGPSTGQANVNGQAPGEPVKRKRGRPSKASQGDVTESAVPKKKGRPRKSGLPEDTSSVPIANSSALPAFVPAPEPVPMAIATTGPDTTVPAPAEPVPAQAASTEDERPATAEPNGASSGKAKRSFKFKTNPDGTPIPRRPYTIRLNPDGTPVSERFKKRVLNGNLGNAAYVSTSQPQSQSHSAAGDSFNGIAIAGPSSQPAQSSYPETLGTLMGEADALGEIDTDMIDLARHVVSVGAQPSSSQPAPRADAPKVKDPIRVERNRIAALKRWQKYREDREALGLPPRASSSTPRVDGRKSGGFAIPGAAKSAVDKRWSMFHADAFASRADRQSTPAEQAYRDAIRSGSIKPMSASPRRIISLSGGGGRPSSSLGQTGTPTRRLPTDIARERAGSMRPRSSLPLFLTPVPTRYPAPPRSEYDEDDAIDLAALPDDAADDDFEPGEDDEEEALGYEDYEEEEVAPAPRMTRGSAGRVHFSPNIRIRSRQGPRSSLPSRLAPTPMSTRPDKGKGKKVARPRAGSLDEPSLRSILTRNARTRAGAPLSASQGSTSRVTRASSAIPARSTRSGVAINTTPRASRSRYSLPSSSQGRSRLVPEVEIGRPKATSVSPVKLEPRPRRRPQYVVTKTRVVAKPKFQQRLVPRVKSRTQPKPTPKRRAILGPRVIIPISRASRARLIASGAFDPFYDDDSDEETTLRRRGHAGLRRIALPRGSQARTARPTEPETTPARFASRSGPELLEPYKSVLDPDTILKRASEHECHWKGCDAQLASEWHLQKHFILREHAAQGAFKSGAYGETTLYRCHWVECEKPCFDSIAGLEQHLAARHISKTLSCPWSKCDLKFSNLSHLTRHALRHHDEPEDRPRPLTDLSGSGSQPVILQDQVLPDTVAAHTLITLPVAPSTYNSVYRRQWCALKVQKGSIAPPNPVLVTQHPAHMLASTIEDDIDSDIDSVYTTLDGGAMTEERLLDEAAGKFKRKLVPVIDVKVRRRAKAGTYQDLFESGDKVDKPIIIDNDDLAAQPDTEAQQEGSPRLRARFDLPDDQVGDDESNGSESEVWAELEDDLANTAVTPAPFPVDSDSDHQDDDQPPPSRQSAEIDEAVGGETYEEPPTPYETYSTPAAFLGMDDSDDEDLVEPSTDAGNQGMDVDEEEEEEPMWPHDMDIERELGGMLDPTMSNVETTTAVESVPVPDTETELPPTDESMDIDPNPIVDPAGGDITPAEPRVPVVEDGTVDPGVQANTPTAVEVEVSETVIETTPTAAGQDIPESVPEVSPPVDEGGSTVAVEKQSSLQPESREPATAPDSSVPDFATLFGKSPAVVDKPLEKSKDVSEPPVPVTALESGPSEPAAIQNAGVEIGVRDESEKIIETGETIDNTASLVPEMPVDDQLDKANLIETGSTDPAQEEAEPEAPLEETLEAPKLPNVVEGVTETSSVSVQQTNTIEQRGPQSLNGAEQESTKMIPEITEPDNRYQCKCQCRRQLREPLPG